MEEQAEQNEGEGVGASAACLHWRRQYLQGYAGADWCWVSGGGGSSSIWRKTTTTEAEGLEEQEEEERLLMSKRRVLVLPWPNQAR